MANPNEESKSKQGCDRVAQQRLCPVAKRYRKGEFQLPENRIGPTSAKPQDPFSCGKARRDCPAIVLLRVVQLAVQVFPAGGAHAATADHQLTWLQRRGILTATTLFWPSRAKRSR